MTFLLPGLLSRLAVVDSTGIGRVSLTGLAVALLLTGLPFSLRAQSPAPSQTPSSASITGTVRDSAGAAVPGVHLILMAQDESADRITTSDAEGNFAFTGLFPGTYQVKSTADGLEPSLSPDIVLNAGESHELPVIAMRVATKSTTVDVTATANEIAQAQVKEQEKQHVLGFLPNPYTSYIWNPAPMTPKLKFSLGFHSITDPAVFVVAATMAGVEQSHNTFPGYGQGAEGYAKRFGATYADTATLRMLNGAVFPSLFHQDPRYFYQGSGTVRSRILHALSASIIRRADDGHFEPNYSQWLGNFTTAGLSNL